MKSKTSTVSDPAKLRTKNPPSVRAGSSRSDGLGAPGVFFVCAVVFAGVSWPASAPCRADEWATSSAALDGELTAAVRRCDREAARAAVARGASVHRFVGGPSLLESQTQLCLAVMDGNACGIKLLVELGANPNDACAVARTPLTFASSYVHPDTVEALLLAGADPNLPDPSGSPPLATALGQDGRPIRNNVQTLRRHGARAGDAWGVYFALNASCGAAIDLGHGRDVGALWALRPEIVLKRPYASLGWGAYLEAATLSWQTADLGGGLVLAPAFWIVPSVGAFAHHPAQGSFGPGFAAALFIGAHASNAAIPDTSGWGGTLPRPSTKLYVKGDAGLRIEGRFSRDTSSLGVALHLDLNYLWLLPYWFVSALGCCR